MHKLNAIVFFLGIVLWSTPVLAQEVNVCSFDSALMVHFVRGNLSEVPAILDYIKENAPKVRNEICKDESMQSKLTHLAGSLYRTERPGYSSVPVAYTKYKNFSGQEVNGRILTAEENAVYNLVMDYMISKYDMLYALAKKTSLQKNSKLKTGAFVEYMITYRLKPDNLGSAAKELVKTPTGIAVDAATSWATLWIQKENPYEHDSYYDFDYSWLLIARDNFFKRYPNSPYRTALQTLINQDIVTELYEADKNSGVLGLSIGVSVGKSLMTSGLETVDEYFTLSVPNARIQVFRFVFQLQVDLMIASGISAVGLDAMVGPTFEFDEYGFDILAGLGFDEFFVGQDTIMNLAFMGGIQAMRRFPLGSMANITPKLQWILKTVNFDDPVKNRKRRAFINQLGIGITFEARQPLSRLNAFK
jgi:hypothetical protein